ncbi:MAG TPA: acyl-CoA thioesterase, partial [Bacteroidales bacterium]|nr:acyl-CoA thioesterase [Bacteroidales bacterium]
IPIQIRMSDLDPFNHVNNGIQCSYLDLGRSAFIEEILGDKIDWLTIDLVLAHISLDFVVPINYGDKIICACKVTHLGNKSFKMVQHIIDSETGIIKTKSESVIVGLDREKLVSIPIKQEYREKLKEFENQHDKNI